MADGSQALLAPTKPLNSRQKRQLMEAALDRLLSAVEGVLADLDTLDGEADLEPSLGFLERHNSLASTSGDQRRITQGAQDDREVECEDEGAQCEDEGSDTDSEPDETHGAGLSLCNWQDEGDQSELLCLPIWRAPPSPDVKSPHQNVGPLMAVKVLP